MSEQDKAFEGISPLRLMRGKPKYGAWQMITREEALVRYGVLHRLGISDRSKWPQFVAFRALCCMAFGLEFEADAYLAMQNGEVDACPLRDVLVERGALIKRAMDLRPNRKKINAEVFRQYYGGDDE